MEKKKEKNGFIRFWEILSSHGLTTFLLVALMIITLVGTIAQRKMGLFQSQKIYFSSYFFTFPLGPLKIPFLGGLTVLSLLFLNLITAFALKFRFRWRMLGLWICHIGIFLLLVGSFLTFKFSWEGYVDLSEGMEKSSASSYQNYELMVIRGDESPEYERVTTISEHKLRKSKALQIDSLPFEIQVVKYYPNCSAITGEEGTIVRLDAAKADPKQERDMAGAELLLVGEGKKSHKIFVFANTPQLANYKGKIYQFLMRHERKAMPFTIKLRKFIKETHPGTNTPSRFESKADVIEGDRIQKVRIYMNHPLRYKGYTLFQSSWFSDPATGQLHTVLAMVKNPAEAWPYLSSLLVLLGMLIHFILKLVRFLNRNNARKIHEENS